MQDPLLFTVTVLLILGTPGPTNTLLATAGATVGFRRALPLLPAEAAGYLVAILVIGLALGPFIAGLPAVAIGLRLAVGAYLALLAVKLWRRGPVDLSVMPVTPRQVFVTTLLNPKAIVFALGVIPFGAGHWWPWMLGFLGLLSGVALGWILLGSLLGRAAGAAGRAGLVPKLGAAAVGAFAVLLVVGPLLR